MSDTEIWQKHKLMKAVIELIFKRLETIVISAAIAGALAYYNHHKESNDVQWIGEHLSKKQNIQP